MKLGKRRSGIMVMGVLGFLLSAGCDADQVAAIVLSGADLLLAIIETAGLPG